MMMRRYVLCFLIALTLTTLMAAVGWETDSSIIGALILPGVILGNIVFPGGIHSDHPMAFMVVIGLMEAFVLSWPVFFLWNKLRILRRRSNKFESRDAI